MKYIRIFPAIFIILCLIFTGCKNTEINEKMALPENNAVLQGVNIFDKEKNLSTDYIPENNALLNSVVDELNYGKALVISEDGSVIRVNPSESYFQIDKDSIGITGSNTEAQKIKGIYLSDNSYSITDVYYDSKKYIDNNEKIMVVLLDGFSYRQYKDAVKNGYITFLNQFFKHEALSVYTPVTNAGYAAMITGQTPDINGVHDRSYRQMDVESIFGYANSLDKKSVLLEGDIKILNTETEPKLHVDFNRDGDTDDEMYEKSIDAAKEGYDFIFIHFHGIDDRGHSYGPDSEITMEYIKKVDEYIKNLSKVWGGSIILTADHGMHETADGGSHGECRFEDMVVPYFHIVKNQ